MIDGALQSRSDSEYAFVNVSVISMDSERVESGQTVIVRGDRIAAIGASTEALVPRGATIIDGSGQTEEIPLVSKHVMADKILDRVVQLLK